MSEFRDRALGLKVFVFSFNRFYLLLKNFDADFIMRIIIQGLKILARPPENYFF